MSRSMQKLRFGPAARQFVRPVSERRKPGDSRVGVGTGLTKERDESGAVGDDGEFEGGEFFVWVGEVRIGAALEQRANECGEILRDCRDQGCASGVRRVRRGAGAQQQTRAAHAPQAQCQQEGAIPSPNDRIG